MVEVEVYHENITPFKPESEKYEPIEFDIAKTAIEKTHPVWQPDSIEHKDVDLDFMGQ